MTQIEKVLYTAKTHTTGGRDGASRASDGRLDVKLSSPGTAGGGTNPEQLFAAGWSACFMSAIGLAASQRKVALPPDFAVHVPAPMAPDPRAIETIADKLLKAEHPMLLAEYAGRRPNGFNNIVELAETTGSAVWDVNNALNFPNKHPLCLSMDKASLRHTDLVLGGRYFGKVM